MPLPVSCLTARPPYRLPSQHPTLAPATLSYPAFQPRTGEEYEPTRLSEYYETTIAVGVEDSKLNSMIEETQNKDTFTKATKAYLSSGQLPQDLLPLLIEENSEIDEDEDEDKVLPKQKRHCEGEEEI